MTIEGQVFSTEFSNWQESITHLLDRANVVDAITGATLTSHTTHNVSWDCLDLDGNIVPDGEYTIWVEFTEKHAQGPLYSLNFTKGPDAQIFTPSDETYFKDIELEFTPFTAEFISNATEDNPLVKNVYKNIAKYNENLKLWQKKLIYLNHLDY